MASAHFAMGVERVRAVLGEPPVATVILSLADGPLRRDELAHALIACGVATTMQSDAALARVLRQLTADGTVTRSSTADGEHGVYELTGYGRARARVIGTVLRVARRGCALSR